MTDITRRRFLQAGLAGVSALAVRELALLDMVLAELPAVKQPNLLFVFPDQHRFD